MSLIRNTPDKQIQLQEKIMWRGVDALHYYYLFQTCWNRCKWQWYCWKHCLQNCHDQYLSLDRLKLRRKLMIISMP